MTLKEIEMDLPYIRDHSNENLSSDEIRLDYEKNWKEKRRKFQLMTRCMTAMVERIMSPIKTEDCWKILIECVENNPRKEFINLLGVYSVQVSFEINKFNEMNDLQKKQYIIEKIIEVTNNLSQCTNFSLKEVEHACHEIISSNYRNEWFWNKAVKTKRYLAQIKILHEIENVSLFMVFFDTNNNQIDEKLLLSVDPDERVYSDYLGKIEWITSSSVMLHSKNGEKYVVEYQF